MNRNRSSAALLAASLMALAGVGAVSNAVDPGTQQIRESFGGTASSMHRDATQAPSRLGERNAIAKAMFGGIGRGRPTRFPNGPGWTHAHVGRMKAKRKNKARNKRAHRG